MPNLLLATRNRHKVEELRDLLGDDFEVQTLGEFPEVPALPETAGSFVGNATLKALTMAQWIGALQEAGDPILIGEIRYVMADDSGLEVDALEGAPGVHSARYAATNGDNSSDADNNAKLLRELENMPPEKRAAQFVCELALTEVVSREATPEAHLFEGRCKGCISESPRGEHGFGYDPLFIPAGHEQTFGELGGEIKSQLSHRAQALTKMIDWLKQAAS